MAGQVQMIYFDPPYGICYGSNFQPFVNKRDVKASHYLVWYATDKAQQEFHKVFSYEG
jgi:hypothetical protein